MSAARQTILESNGFEANAFDATTASFEQSRPLGDHARRLQHDAETLSAEIRGTAVDLELYVAHHLTRRPFTTLGTAAVVGYVLGGGLTSRLTFLLLGPTARLVATLALSELAGRAQNDPILRPRTF